jgi:hypothetical protein
MFLRDRWREVELQLLLVMQLKLLWGQLKEASLLLKHLRQNKVYPLANQLLLEPQHKKVVQHLRNLHNLQ